MSEITKEEMRERMGNIEQIRDILFGPKLQEYDSRIDKLESQLSLLEKEMRDRTEKVKTDCLTELRTAVDLLEQKIKSLSLTSQKDNADLRQLLDRTYRNFYSSIESIDKNVDNQTTSLRQDLSETREKLQDDIRNLKSQIFDELEKRFSTLTDVKVSRDDIAEMLFELGLRIKKAELTPSLNESKQPEVSDDLLLIEARRVSESAQS